LSRLNFGSLLTFVVSCVIIIYIIVKLLQCFTNTIASFKRITSLYLQAPRPDCTVITAEIYSYTKSCHVVLQHINHPVGMISLEKYEYTPVR
jgi:hypothetical protein